MALKRRTQSRVRVSKEARMHHASMLAVSIAFGLGVLVTVVVTQVFAQMTNNDVINACVNKVNGQVRILSAGDSCKNSETALTWNKEGPPGTPGPQGVPGSGGSGSGLPYTCYNCTLFPYGDKFRGEDFSNAQIQNSEFVSADLSGVIFKGAFLSSDGFRSANLTGADFSVMAQDVIKNAPSGYDYASQNLDFTGANLTNVTFQGSIVQSDTFKTANLQNTNFSNAVIKQSNFKGATNGSTANFSGATWDSTVCADGTNSNSNGNTCVGHM